MNNGFKNKRTKKNEDKLKWNYRKIIIRIKHIVKHKEGLKKRSEAIAMKWSRELRSEEDLRSER